MKDTFLTNFSNLYPIQYEKIIIFICYAKDLTRYFLLNCVISIDFQNIKLFEASLQPYTTIGWRRICLAIEIDFFFFFKKKYNSSRS